MRVGIIGAGISGVVTGAHLHLAGIDFTVFERSSAAGGAWLYDERIPLEPKYPATKPSQADFVGGDRQLKPRDIELLKDFIEESLAHAPPGPCYEGLSNNVSTRLMKLRINTWKPGTEDYVLHHVLRDYIQDTAQKAGVHEKTLYNTRVNKLSKRGSLWELRSSTLTEGTNGHRYPRILEKTWKFDAIVVASGHYHACRIPDIPGLSDWKKAWPGRVQHSKSYRNPKSFKDQNVLLIGAGVSSTDIAKELGPEAAHTYQSSRGGKFDLPAILLPKNASRVGELASFESPPYPPEPLSNDLEPIPKAIHLSDGTVLRDIHRIIVCTGYHISLPFLPEYHSDDTPVEDANDTVLVTDGTQVHNLHKDIFYIPDPSLAFVGIPYYTATFSLFEFQAIAVAAVFAKRAFLPTQEQMREEYRLRLESKGAGKGFHSLKDHEVEYADELVEWLNRDARVVGAELVEGHTEAWHVAKQDQLARMKAMVAGAKPGTGGIFESVVGH